MALAKHVMTTSFEINNFYDISDSEVSGDNARKQPTDQEGQQQELQQDFMEINMTVELVCCPEIFSVKVTKLGQKK